MVINMPRSPYRRNKVPFPPWFTKIETGMERKYIRIGETMIKSEAWNTLPSSTTKLLLCMMYVANGKQHFQAENNLRDAIHEARARAYHTQTSEGDQHDLTLDDESLHHGCCGLHCGHGGWSHHSADR